ncbi:hypothetical protein CPB84DRAFT_1819655 [Gymnopilus junonius]|uniref:CxC6 like cysteine cluster associated with KDZ domain-containing protein n=1 Tax=Gymnopilus junonius TaxID=109634 RepID=A0A9P5TEC1_GYMJU|nr:hypothetical protein CPB84DRAFT_1819655 [Gymnopilus junonius]
MWLKYKECLKAIQAAKELQFSGRWPTRSGFPHFTEQIIIDIFIPKTTWYKTYAKIFPIVEGDAPAMRAWLEKNVHTPEEDLKLWGYNQNEYEESDLRWWLEERNLLKDKTSKEDMKKAEEDRQMAERLARLEQEREERQERERLEREERERREQERPRPSQKRKKNTGPRRLFSMHTTTKLILFLGFMPLVSAAQNTQPFPDIPFRTFSTFISNTFHPDVPLATVLLVLFTLTDNTDLLNLHGHQQNPQYLRENKTLATGWIRALSRDLIQRLGGQLEMVTKVAVKLNALSQKLDLNPYSNGDFKRKLQPVSYDKIRGTPIICPSNMFCLNQDECDPRALHQATKLEDIPLVTLVKQNTVYRDVPVLTGKLWNKYYLNSAKYLKVGQSVWVDRPFAQGVVNGTYNFHASASAYMQYWNDSTLSKEANFQFSRRQIWQAFIQESIRMVATVNNTDLALQENLNIEKQLGKRGVIPVGMDHSCSECTQPYKATADLIGNDDPAAVDVEMDSDPVKMIILDGIVMGPTHCSFDGCTDDLKNARGGALCANHEIAYGTRCRVRDCIRTKIAGTHACQNHQAAWRKYRLEHSSSALAGIRRRLQRPDEHLPWQNNNVQPRPPRRAHDSDDDDEPPPRTQFFGPSKFYCVETICAPCGVVIAWTKFDRSESPTKILQFITDVYPESATRPAYICIDKACKVLRTAITHDRWQNLLDSSRFIVDSYHYINHRVTDYLCRKWCNPAPLDGSAPNLVKTAIDKDGNQHLTRAFNTQACEQLNAC